MCLHYNMYYQYCQGLGPERLENLAQETGARPGGGGARSFSCQGQNYTALLV